MEFGPLVESVAPPANLTGYSVEKIARDIYNPGHFLFNAGGALLSYSPNDGVAVLAGNVAENGLKDGSAADARFSLLVDFTQYNETMIAIVDIKNHCIRKLDTKLKLVSHLIGSCHFFSNPSSEYVDFEEPGKNVSADTDILNHPTRILYVSSRNYFLTYDLLNNLIIKVDMYTNTAALLIPHHHSESLPKLAGLIVDRVERHLYASHDYGITKIDLETLDSELIVGTIAKPDENMEMFIPISAGPFADAYITTLTSLQWLIQDAAIVAVSGQDNEAIAVLDLVNEEVMFLCNGKLHNLHGYSKCATCYLTREGFF